MRRFLSLVIVLSIPLANSAIADESTQAVDDAVDQALEARQAGEYGRALQQLQAPAEGGYWRAQFVLAQMYTFGEGVPQDKKHAEVLFTRAVTNIQALAEQGDAVAQYHLGVAYQTGLGGLGKDLERAEEWFARAERNGYEATQ